jgi:hypothetical protein
MTIQLHYRNHDKEGIDHDGPVCFVDIQVLPTWNSRTNVQFQQLPHAGVETQIYRYRYMFGLSISVSATGEFAWLDFKKLVQVITASLVLLSLPNNIILIVALYLAGRLSRIYSFVSQQTFSIVDEFPGLCSRVLGYASNHETLCSEVKVMQKDGSSVTRSGLDNAKLMESMLEVLKKEVDAQVLSKDEIQRMVSFLMYQMDPTQSWTVDMGEYCKACNYDQAVKISDVSECFDETRQASCLDKLRGDIADDVRAEQKKFKYA